MNKVYTRLLSIAIALILIICVLNISVATKQAINGKVSAIKLPLYLKILDFMDRHYNYKNLVANILAGTRNENDKAVKIFNWVVSHVQKKPKELPVIDDHPLNILIRGYGMQDQLEDIFTILCTYAGMDSIFKSFKNSSGDVYYVSLIKINGRWCPLSASGGVYAARNGVVVSVDDILLDRKLLAPFISNMPDFEPDTFLKEISTMDYRPGSMRVIGQSPIGRALFHIKKMVNR